jgi:methylase of polypeptide subunit release factors
LNKYKNSLTKGGIIALEIGATQKKAISEIIKKEMLKLK